MCMEIICIPINTLLRWLLEPNPMNRHNAGIFGLICSHSFAPPDEVKGIKHGQIETLRSTNYEKLYRSKGRVDVFFYERRSLTTIFVEKFFSLSACERGYLWRKDQRCGNCVLVAFSISSRQRPSQRWARRNRVVWWRSPISDMCIGNLE